MEYLRRFRLRSHDVTPNNVWKLHMIMRYLHEGADNQMRDRKPSYYELNERGIALILVRFTVEILEDLRMYDDFQVATWTCDAQTRGASYMRYYQIRHNDKICVNARGLWGMVNIEDKKLLRVESEIFKNYEDGEPIKEMLRQRFTWPKCVDFVKAGSKEVLFSDIDVNGHMNNTNYGKLMCDFIPDIRKKTVTSLNIHFKKEALEGQQINVYRGKCDPDFMEQYGDKRGQELYIFKTETEGKQNLLGLVGVKNI